MILHAQLEIWKAAYSDEDLNMRWQPETTSSNASSGDISEGKKDKLVQNRFQTVMGWSKQAKPASSTCLNLHNSLAIY